MNLLIGNFLPIPIPKHVSVNLSWTLNSINESSIIIQSTKLYISTKFFLCYLFKQLN